MRASLEKRENYWALIDGQYNSIVLTTQNRKIAEFWKNRVDKCQHQRPYDILWHDVTFNKNPLAGKF